MSEPLYVIRHESLYIAPGAAARTTDLAKAERFTRPAGKRKLAALLSGNRRRYPPSWVMESAPTESGAQ